MSSRVTRSEVEPRTTPSVRKASGPQTARVRPPRGELLLTDAVVVELDRLGAVRATVPFDGSADEDKPHVRVRK
jgi:hypothetical protein